MSVKRRYLIVSGAILALASGGAGTATAVSGDDGAQRATEAALATPGGDANAIKPDQED